MKGERSQREAVAEMVAGPRRKRLDEDLHLERD